MKVPDDVKSVAGAFLVVGCIVVVVMAPLLLLESPALSADQWYATFQYNGKTYAYSYASGEDYWTTIVGWEYRYAENPAPDGNAGDKGQDWCNDVLITSGTDDQYDDWFLPNFDESMAGLNGYVGGDPLNLNPPALCHGYANMSLRSLWTSETCYVGTLGCDRAYFVHRSTIIDDYNPYLDCNNSSGWCCFKKAYYGIVHTCPMARCVRIVDASYHWADLDQDGDVDVEDTAAVANRWRCLSGEDCYDAACDIDEDDKITVVDIALVTAEIGEGSP